MKCHFFTKILVTKQTKKETIKAMQNEYVEFVQKVSSMYPTQFYHFYPLFGEENINI